MNTSKLVELSLNETTMEIEVQPRDIDPRIELDVYSIVNNPGVPAAEKAAKEFFSKAETTFSPFDRSSFEPLLRSAVTYLDPKGLYWPSHTSADDRSLPKPSEELKVTDTWVLFAMPRSTSLFIQDIERFKKKLEDKTITLPPPVTAIVTDPATTNEDVPLPPFRGVSTICGSAGQSDGSRPVQDLFFPMPFNNEQARIAQLLECSDGVVVQGPPGTGKTHTIGNIICHYLALGKRVLVTSMKDPALVVLQDKLPAEIRPLAISLLTSEQEGMKQFMYAVEKIAAEVQRLDRLSLSREITQIENSIDAYHAKLAKIDNQIGEWAGRNLTPIEFDGEIIEPLEAAEIIIRNEQTASWLEDAISIGTEFRPRFSDSGIVRLRDARRALLDDLDYLGVTLPLISAFPDARELIRAHQDLARAAELQSHVDSGKVTPLADSSKQTFDAAQSLLSQIDMVVEGHHDNRLAIECDGDRYHGPDKWDDDIRRQRILERAGWRFWRCFASTFVMDRQGVIQDLIATLEGHGIAPIGSENNEALSIHTEQRKITVFNKSTWPGTSLLRLAGSFEGPEDLSEQHDYYLTGGN